MDKPIISADVCVFTNDLMDKPIINFLHSCEKNSNAPFYFTCNADRTHQYRPRPGDHFEIFTTHAVVCVFTNDLMDKTIINFLHSCEKNSKAPFYFTCNADRTHQYRPCPGDHLEIFTIRPAYDQWWPFTRHDYLHATGSLWIHVVRYQSRVEQVWRL